MPNKILITYATRAGSTLGIAEAVGKTLVESDIQADILPVKEVASFEGYDAIILGTAVRMGRLMPEMIQFAKKNKILLSRYPVAAFAVCLGMKEDTPERHPDAEKYLDPLRNEIPLVSEGFFAGSITYASLDIFMRFLIKKMVKAPEGDFRDWRKIEAWTHKFLERLEAETTKETSIEKSAVFGA